MTIHKQNEWFELDGYMVCVDEIKEETVLDSSSKPPKDIRLLLLILLASLLLAACGGLAPGSQKERDKTAQIETFLDADRDGKRDPGEIAIPDVLIAARSNIHGMMTFTAKLTDADGQAHIAASYTHFFDLAAFPPCGYEATTPTEVEAGRKAAFGFAPTAPQPGLADLYILLWHDENQDGVYQTGEIPLAGEMLSLDPGLPWGAPFDIVTGNLLVSTNSGGEAAANLGNSCGAVAIPLPTGWRPASAEGDGVWDENLYRVPYQPGRTNIFLGVIPEE
ncbi:MAG: hypothetical protein GY796_25605 [Chloroflexi bacterium]|nr:hypothetical protein [Chloroflexota bacterium]